MIILNSILWYLYNRLDCMKTDVLISVITQFYSDKEIEEAKKVLFENFTSHRIMKRKGENKTEMNLKDMLELLHVTSSNPQPEVTFATASCNFPLLDFKNIDSGTIISNLQALKNEVRDMQQESVSNKTLSNQPAEVRSMVSELSALSKKKQFLNKQLVGLLVLTSLQLKTCKDSQLTMIYLQRKAQCHFPKQYNNSLIFQILVLFPQLLRLALLT